MIAQKGKRSEESFKAIGEGMTTLGKVVEKHAEQNEIATGISKLADLTHDIDLHYNELAKSADIHDPDFSKTYKQQYLDPAMQEFLGTFQTPGGKSGRLEQPALTPRSCIGSLPRRT